MRNDSLTDYNAALKAAFDSTLRSRIIETIPETPDHKFSRRYRKKMKKLERHSLCASEYGGGIRFDKVPLEKGSFKKVSLKKLITYALIAALLAALTALSVGAARDLYKKFFMTNFDTHTVVKSADDMYYPKSILNAFSLDVPNNFTLTEKYEDETFISHVYRTENNEYIFFNQYTKTEYDINVNTENNPINYIDINGREGMIVDFGNNEYYISWDNGDYIFDITGNVGKNALIEAAKSVQKVEN